MELQDNCPAKIWTLKGKRINWSNNKETKTTCYDCHLLLRPGYHYHSTGFTPDHVCTRPSLLYIRPTNLLIPVINRLRPTPLRNYNGLWTHKPAQKKYSPPPPRRLKNGAWKQEPTVGITYTREMSKPESIVHHNCRRYRLGRQPTNVLRSPSLSRSP